MYDNAHFSARCNQFKIWITLDICENLRLNMLVIVRTAEM